MEIGARPAWPDACTISVIPVVTFVKKMYIICLTLELCLRTIANFALCLRFNPAEPLSLLSVSISGDSIATAIFRDCRTIT